MNAVEVRDLFRVYSTPEGHAAALQGLSLSVQEKEVLVVLGPSGSGKSTLLKVLAGLVAGLGLLGGLIAAALLAVLAVDLVTLTAGASLPEPPLAISVDWALVALACAAYGFLTAALVAFSTRRAV